MYSCGNFVSKFLRKIGRRVKEDSSKKSPVDLVIVTGEPSGDLHGTHLVRQLLEKRPNLRIAGVAGEKMRKENIEVLFPAEKFGVMGFFDVFFAFPKIVYWFYYLRKKILRLQPKAIIFIDYPGFNLRLQRSLRKKGYKGKLIQYVCPSVWAWGKSRIALMEKQLDLLLTIFPFEEKIFTHSSLKVHYVGNPSVKLRNMHQPAKDFFSKKKPTLGIFPGSRKTEILRNLPIQLRAAKLLAFQPVIACAEERLLPFILSILEKEHFSAEIAGPDKRYDLMEQAEVAIATSGTVTLELALFKTPTLVTYQVPLKEYFIIAKILKIDLPFYCIVNILENEEIFPELFGPNLTAARIEYAALNWLANKEKTDRCKEKLLRLQITMQNSSSLRDVLLFEIGV